MELQELIAKLRRVLGEYESEDRGSQRALEIITAMFNGYGECPDALPAPLKQIRSAVNGWDQGDRSDIDVLETILALTRQL